MITGLTVLLTVSLAVNLFLAALFWKELQINTRLSYNAYYLKEDRRQSTRERVQIKAILADANVKPEIALEKIRRVVYDNRS